ncbi:hypothetical protein ACEPPN_011140 [Leptodophora sp. 'Broadleaf-Isolate-01']
MALENFDIERSDQEMVRRTLLSSMSFWLTITRMLQIALSFTVLFCTGYTANIFLGDWIFVTPRRFPKAYQYKVHM